MSSDPLEDFHPIIRRWFSHAYGAPTPPQQLGWPSIAAARNTLILAPTGSGKTLAAFLWAINHLVEQHLREELAPGVRILYISPLKALNNDIERNLRIPLAGIRAAARDEGVTLPQIRAGVRTGDTPAAQRNAMVRHPPDILITTPESLYLMLTSKRARGIFRTVQYLIVDEIHALCGNKRGVHLSLSLERLQAVAEQECVRIGLSATQRPLERVAAFLGGQEVAGTSAVPRPVHVVDAGRKKEMDLRVFCPAPDFSQLPQESVWPLLFSDMAEMIRRHRTTLIFVNNRRLAERVAAKLNEELESGAPIGPINLSAVPVPTARQDATAQNPPLPVPDDPILAYHGSMSRAAREQMERRLKAGELRALVATSSLELGIDIGSVDLVIQIQSPKGIARGLQRVGRSGHLVTATSKGRILPTHREDLVECAVVARAMLRHEVEETVIPENCLDVLAQQVVAMVSAEDWHVEDLHNLIRRSYCYRDLSRQMLLRVLGMVGGKYTSGELRELRPLVSWDSAHGVLRALPGSGRLAVTSGGTIADRGYYGVYLEDKKTKVGEVDEEFIFESRAGDTFILGSTVWRMTSIEPNRITVVPAPGQPARMPFWRGEGIGRSYELGCRVGEFRRELGERLESPGCLEWLESDFPMDAHAAWNLQEYFRRQAAATGLIPSDRLILVEGSRDEIGDPRIIVHSSFGRRVNGLLGLVLAHRLEELTGVAPQMLYNDDGILLRSPESDALPLNLFEGLTVQAGQDLVLEDMLSSPLFAGQFRQAAGRALLMPRSSPRKRTPLWLQRLRAGDLLQLVRRFEDFPIVIETVREVLHDVLDLEHFKEILAGIESGAIAVSMVETDIPSPFSASLLFDFLAVYMYEQDQPKADRFSRYLSINRELLSEVIDVGSLPPMIRPEAVESVEEQLQHLAGGTQARSPEELSELLIRLGDLTDEELLSRCKGDGRAMAAKLEADGRALRLEFPGGPRWISVEDEPLYREQNHMRRAVMLASRFVRNHGPISLSALASRYGFSDEELRAVAGALESDGTVVRGAFLPTGAQERAGDQWCYRPNLERIHRQTIAVLRKEIVPSTREEFNSFLLQWQGIQPSSTREGIEGVQDVLLKLEGFPAPPETWERDLLMRRLPKYDPADMTRLGSRGAVVWIGTGTGKIKPVFRPALDFLLPQPSGESDPELHEGAKRIMASLKKRGASFLGDIRKDTALSLDALNRGIAELFWQGLITNDVFGEILTVMRYGGAASSPMEPVVMLDPWHNPARGRLMHSVRRALRESPGWTGRWSLLRAEAAPADPANDEECVEQQAALLLERYGVVAREFHRREELLPWPLIAMEFQRLEMRGEIRRGYFVEGLSGMQYALPAAVDQLRRVRSSGPRGLPPVLLNACDPANVYGTGTGWALSVPGAEQFSVARIPGNYLAMQEGRPILLIEGYGARLWTPEPFNEQGCREALARLSGMLRLPEGMRPFRHILVEQCNGVRPVQSPLAEILRSLGFSRDRDQTMRLDTY